MSAEGQGLQETNAGECRICLENDTRLALICPCVCNGSLKYVHKQCILTWINTSQTVTCNICKSDYRCRIDKRRGELLQFAREQWFEAFKVLLFTALYLVLIIILYAIDLQTFNSLRVRCRQKPISYRLFFAKRLFSTVYCVFSCLLQWCVIIGRVYNAWDKHYVYSIED